MHAARKAIVVALCALAGILIGLAAPTPAPTVMHYRDGATVGAKKPGTSGHLVRYGWDWNETVDVLDATGNPVWDVRGAVAKWAKVGFPVRLTTDETAADVVVTQGDANTMCGMTASIIGCTDTTVVNGEPVSARIVMSSKWVGWGYTETQRGGLMHEMSHALGWTHAAGYTNADTVTGVPIPSKGARTDLSRLDRAAVRSLP